MVVVLIHIKKKKSKVKWGKWGSKEKNIISQYCQYQVLKKTNLKNMTKLCMARQRGKKKNASKDQE